LSRCLRTTSVLEINALLIVAGCVLPEVTVSSEDGAAVSMGAGIGARGAGSGGNAAAAGRSMSAGVAGDLGSAGRISAVAGANPAVAGGVSTGGGGAAGTLTGGGGAAGTLLTGGGGAAGTLTGGSGAAGTLTGGSGAAGTLNDAPWTSPTLLEERSEEISAVRLARNRKGDLVVAWWQLGSQGEYLWAKRFVNGAWDQTPYSAAKAAADPGAIFPVAHVGIEQTSGAAQLFFIGSDNELRWVRWSGEPAALVQPPAIVPGTTRADFPLTLAVAEGAGSTAVWAVGSTDPMNSYTFNNNVFGLNRWFTADTLVQFNDVGGDFRVATNYSNYVIAVPSSEPTDGSLTRSIQTHVVLGATGTTPAPIQLPGLPAKSIVLALDDAGSATALITLASDSMLGAPLYGSRYTVAAGTWTTPTPLTSGTATRIGLTTTHAGTATAVWLEATGPLADGSKGRLVTRTCSDAGWSEATNLTGEIALLNAGFAASSNESGSTIVVWAQADADDHKSLQFTRFTRDVGWSMPAEISAFGGDGAIVGVTLADDGHAIVVWTEAPIGTRFRDLKWSRSN
jgi:hypothetical protein